MKIHFVFLSLILISGGIILARPKLNYFEVLNTGFYGSSVLFITLSIQFIIALIFNINFHTNFFDTTTAIIYTCWSLFSGYDLFKRYRVSWLVPPLLLAMIVGGAAYMFLSREISSGDFDVSAYRFVSVNKSEAIFIVCIVITFSLCPIVY